MTATARTLLCISLCLLATSPAMAEWNVWTTSHTRRVLRDEPAAKGTEVRVAAARNEWRGFQVLVRSDAPLEGVGVEPGDLRGPASAVIPAADARLYLQHQIELAEGSYRNKDFRPGWYPDPLIPFRHPLTGKPLGQARFAAMPFSVPAGQTHGFWVDLYVPVSAAAGTYRGTYRVTARGQKPVELPVTLAVWDFALPETPTFHTALGSPAQRMRSYYQKRAKAGKESAPTDWAAVDAQCAALLSEHRINATPPAEALHPVEQADGSFRIPVAQIAALREFIDRYHVNAIQTPHPSSAVKDPIAERQRLRAWLAAWDAAAKDLDRPHVVFYTYLKDEPNDREEYEYVQKWGRAVREARSALKVLVVEQTWTQDESWGDLYGAVDIWCPLFCLHKQDSAAKRQALGEIVWTYTALCQGGEPTPWWQIDFPLLNYRVPMWMAWNDRMRGILYWGGMSFWDQVDDPWTDPKTLDRRKGKKDPLYNGEGTLVYPARPAGYEGIAPSLRLKALRDGIQDYEYLAILQRQGRAAEAEKVARSVTTSFFQWDHDPDAYETARERLAEWIVKAKPQAPAAKQSVSPGVRGPG